MPDEKRSTHTCEHCRRVFTRASNKQRHVRGRCSSTLALASDPPSPQEFGPGRIHTAEAKEQHTTTVDLSRATIGGEAHVEVHGDHHVENHNQIHINIFGQEDFSYATEMELSELAGKTYDRVHKDALAVSFLDAVLRFLYGNAEHPENLTAFIPNIKSDGVKIYTGERWESHAFSEVYPTISANASSRIQGSMHIPCDADKEEYERVHDTFECASALIREHGNKTPVSPIRQVLHGNRDLLKRIERERAAGGGAASGESFEAKAAITTYTTRTIGGGAAAGDTAVAGAGAAAAPAETAADPTSGEMERRCVLLERELAALRRAARRARLTPRGPAGAAPAAL